MDKLTNECPRSACQNADFVKEAGQNRQYARHQSGHCCDIESFLIVPSVDKALVGAQQPPGLESDAQQCSQEGALPERAHEDREADLVEDLVLLTAGVAGEVWDVERQRRPVADAGGERREEEIPELGDGEAGRHGKHAPEAVGLDIGPAKEGRGEEDEDWCRVLLELSNHVHTPQDDAHLGQPEDQEAGELQRRRAQPGDDDQGGGGTLEHGWEEEEHGLVVDPGLNVVPSVADEGTEGHDVGVADAKCGVSEDREGHDVSGAEDVGEDEGEEHDEVGDDDGGDALPPGHVEVDEAVGEVVGGNTNDEAHPVVGHIPGGEGAGGYGDGSEVGAVDSGIRIGRALGDYNKGGGRRANGRRLKVKGRRVGDGKASAVEFDGERIGAAVSSGGHGGRAGGGMGRKVGTETEAFGLHGNRAYIVMTTAIYVDANINNAERRSSIIASTST
ncbi:hypothetical protein B296_00040442 [Ensete ventricosum]|uniref:Uncharacterized protein n=1 Tax=Ensete ventricosum TaxID=4639 RepID=A0A426ZIW4_ENSVE|nr:hypothetical protein B296_00040442 [Ensete ventricosum]